MHNTIKIELLENDKVVEERNVTNAVATGYLYDMMENLKMAILPACGGISEGHWLNNTLLRENVGFYTYSDTLYLLNTKDTVVDSKNCFIKKEDTIVGKASILKPEASVLPLTGVLQVDKCYREKNRLTINTTFYEGIANGTFNCISITKKEYVSSFNQTGPAFDEGYNIGVPYYIKINGFLYSTAAKRIYYFYNNNLCSKTNTTDVTVHNLLDITNAQMVFRESNNFNRIVKICENQMLILYNENIYFYTLQKNGDITLNFVKPENGYVRFENVDSYSFYYDESYLYYYNSGSVYKCSLTVQNQYVYIPIPKYYKDKPFYFENAESNEATVFICKAKETNEPDYKLYRNILNWKEKKATQNEISEPKNLTGDIRVIKYNPSVAITERMSVHYSVGAGARVYEKDESKEEYAYNCMTKAIFEPITKQEGQIMRITYTLNFE